MIQNYFPIISFIFIIIFFTIYGWLTNQSDTGAVKVGF